jgi:hypothetical protein
MAGLLGGSRCHLEFHRRPSRLHANGSFHDVSSPSRTEMVAMKIVRLPDRTTPVPGHEGHLLLRSTCRRIGDVAMIRRELYALDSIIKESHDEAD